MAKTKKSLPGKSKGKKDRPEKPKLNIQPIEGLTFKVTTSAKGLLRGRVVEMDTGGDDDPTPMLDLRMWYLSTLGEPLPTSKGMMVPLNLAERLHTRLGKMLAKAKKEGLVTSK